MTSTHRQIIYGVLAVLGIVAPWYHNHQFYAQHENPTAMLFVQQAMLNPAAASITSDIAVVGFVFLIWSWRESRKLKIKHWWLFAVLTFVIALAFTFPLFLLFRERHLPKA